MKVSIEVVLLPSYWLVGTGILITVLLAIGVAMGLRGNEQDLQKDTPEYAVQQFLKAVSKQDYGEIHSSLSNKFDNCSVEDLVSDSFHYHVSHILNSSYLYILKGVCSKKHACVLKIWIELNLQNQLLSVMMNIDF